MSSEYKALGGLQINTRLADLVERRIAPGTGIDAQVFWTAFEALVRDLGPRNRELLDKRDALQERIDAWYRGWEQKAPPDPETTAAFLREIGYLVEEGGDFQVEVHNVDPEIATIAGPQLVVPVQIARYALNAANARWGSLYDALYGTDVIDESGGAARGGPFNPARAARVVRYAKQRLNEMVPLARGEWDEVCGFQLVDLGGRKGLAVSLADGSETGLADSASFAGYRETDDRLVNVLLRHHGLHIEIDIDPENPVGKLDVAGIRDVVLESAITTIQDFEDSVSAVDARDKCGVYQNWAGLMMGDLEASFEKGGKTVTRRMNPDREYTGLDGQPLVLAGRSLMLMRNVGLHMYSDAVLTDGEPVPEGMLDAMVGVLAAKHDLDGSGPYRNSRSGSVYIVKPKLHGPEEVAFAVEIFARVEQALGIPNNTIKIGIMDEERRTTVNLKECIRAARERVIFINTGFLDRTGDEIHTVMEAGPVVPKPEIKGAAWISAYEDWNVDIGIETGLPGHAQIGKGMWPAPDAMAAMVASKGEHPRSGANTAWVPSPTAATLHALHYHQDDVFARQRELASRERASLEDILTPPLLPAGRTLSAGEIEAELENNAQGILGYVVRWIDSGVGCSKVPDIHDVGLMEDRATLRISSQHIANWLHHRITTREQVLAVFRKMAVVVDRQNAGDPGYQPMAEDLDSSTAFQAALDLVFEGRAVANGYTEPVLHRCRRLRKEAAA
ncbi:MAG: malate synthase G [Gammaproteobacteria bacterium]|nr:malate synthase G [Gammaproteobacteria bacterium]